MDQLFDELRVILHNVWKRRWLALLVAWGVCLAGWLIVSMIPNRYESEARVFVQMQSLLPDKIGVTPAERQRDVERVKRTLTSTVNLEKVVRGTDLAKRASSSQEVTAIATGLLQDIKVIEQQENLFQINATVGFKGMTDTENAKLARDVVQRMIDIFVEENLSGDRVETAQTMRFLDDQIAQKQAQMQESEARRVAFETKNMGVLPGAGSSASRRESARMELNQVESNLIAAQGSLAALNGQLASTPPSIAGPAQYSAGGGGNAAARVAQLEAQLSEGISRGWTDSHPDMMAIKSQLGRARAAAASEGGGRMSPGTSSPNPAYVSLRSMVAEKQATVSAMSARKGQLQAELAQYTAQLNEQPGLASEYQKLSKDYDLIKAQYDKLVQSREDIRLRGQMESSTDAMTFRVIDPPSSPGAPVAPGRTLMTSAVLLIGLLAGLGVAFALSQLQTGFVSAKRLAAATGMTVLGSVSEVVSEPQKALSRKRTRAFAGGTIALFAAYALLLVVEAVRRGGLV